MNITYVCSDGYYKELDQSKLLDTLYFATPLEQEYITPGMGGSRPAPMPTSGPLRPRKATFITTCVVVITPELLLGIATDVDPTQPNYLESGYSCCYSFFRKDSFCFRKQADIKLKVSSVSGRYEPDGALQCITCNEFEKNTPTMLENAKRIFDYIALYRGIPTPCCSCISTPREVSISSKDSTLAQMSIALFGYFNGPDNNDIAAANAIYRFLKEEQGGDTAAVLKEKLPKPLIDIVLGYLVRYPSVMKLDVPYPVPLPSES